MPRRYPPEIRRQVVELARSGTKVAQLVATHNAVAAIMRELGIKGLPNRRLPRSARIGRVGGPDQWSTEAGELHGAILWRHPSDHLRDAADAVSAIYGRNRTTTISRQPRRSSQR
jgi:hypothetical protein